MTVSVCLSAVKGLFFFSVNIEAVFSARLEVKLFALVWEWRKLNIVKFFCCATLRLWRLLMSILFRLPLGPFLRRSPRLSEKRVLLVRDDVIGDLLVPTSAVVRWLVEEGYEVYLVLRKELMNIGELLLPQERLLPVDNKLYRSSLSYRYGFLQDIRKIGFYYAIGSTIHSSVNDDIVRSSGAAERWGYKRHNKFKERFRLRHITLVDSLPVMDVSKQEYTSVVEHERHFLETAFKVDISSDSFVPALDPSAAAHLKAHGSFKTKKDTCVKGSRAQHGENAGLGGFTTLKKGESGQVGNATRGGGQGADGLRKELPLKGSGGQGGGDACGSFFSGISDLPQKYIHYLAEAGAIKRVFPPARMLPILFDIAEKASMKVVVTGLKRQDIEHPYCVNLTGQTTLLDVLDIVANASVVVGNESGLTHFAWVLGKKTALFYGGGHWGRFRPTGDVLLLNEICENRCCDWKCLYDSIPVPCVNLSDESVAQHLHEFMAK